MLLINECFCAVRNTPLILNVSKFRKSKCEPFRPFFNWSSLKKKTVKQPKNVEPEIKSLYGYNDENFTKALKERWHDPNIPKQGFLNLMSEFKRFYNEEIATKDLKSIGNIEIPDERRKVRILHKFENEKDLKGFFVLTDSAYLKGRSSASFKLTENETAIFSGNLCKEVPKTGDVDVTGYANLHCPKQWRAFYRLKKYRWSKYTHLVFKVRGDGRSYLVLLHLPNDFTETSYSQYALTLHTRGGPYWQIAKLPFPHFFLIRQGMTSDKQDDNIPLDDIVNMSLTVGGYSGPFRLEIDYIGLEYDEYQKTISPYEQYR